MFVVHGHRVPAAATFLIVQGYNIVLAMSSNKQAYFYRKHINNGESGSFVLALYFAFPVPEASICAIAETRH